MVPNSDEASSSGEQAAKMKNKGGRTTKVSSLNVEKDSEEYRKLRERNNEAVKKSRSRTKLRTQGTLDKVEKLRGENTKLEERIEGLKKELDLLKELFVSHAGTKSMKRLNEVDMETLLAEAAPNSKKKKVEPYAGRDRDVIEKEVQALLGLQDDDSDDEEVEEQPQPSTSRQTENSEDYSAIEDSQEAVVDNSADYGENSMLPDDAIDENSHLVSVADMEGNESQTYTIIEDGSGPTIWTSENGEAVVVTIAEDGDPIIVTPDVQHLQDIIQDQILMME